MAASWWVCRNQRIATAAQNPLPRPLPDLTATLRCCIKDPRTSSCLAHRFTPSTSEANSSGVGALPDAPCIRPNSAPDSRTRQRWSAALCLARFLD